MKRILLSLVVLLGALRPLILDSTLKGAALLTVAAFSALALYKASAARRHLVWLVAVVSLLIVPALSVALPQWRVLPVWEHFPAKEKSVSVAVPEATGTNRTIRTDTTSGPNSSHESPVPFETAGAAEVPLPTPATATPGAHVADSAPRTSFAWLPIVWGGGFALLFLRLLTAHLLLHRSARGCTVLSSDETIWAVFASTSAELGVRERVTLLLDAKRTIPAVWGVFRPHLLLPAEAREWSDGQLRSVLLHELAHIKRRDPLVQWLTQIACALHWWNPLVWLAAWRLHVERERACDDLVLASGVKASAYAEHLLLVASQLSPARWTSACGLAMARKSSLEGRLLAVLSENLNRRGVTSSLAAFALLLGAGIAIPVAMLRAADEKWNPPHVAHIGANDFSSYCVHDGTDAAFVIAYHGDFDSATEGSSNAKTRSWTDSGTITAKKLGVMLTYHRTHTAPGTVSITTAPAEARDLSKPAPAPRAFGQKEYDLAKGRVFLLTDTGTVRQIDIPTPPITDQISFMNLAALIAAVPPQQRNEDVKPVARLQSGTEAKLKWGEPVNGLRMALAWPPSLGESSMGDAEEFFLVVQNVSETAVRLVAGDDAPNPRRLMMREDGRPLQAISDPVPSPGDWLLQPREVAFLRLYQSNADFKDGRTISSAIEKDIRTVPRYSMTADMTIEKAPAGAWTGKLVTGQTRGSADVAAAPDPMHKDARALYEIWQRHARANGDIPGAMIGELAAAVKTFISYNPTWETVPTLNALLPRLDATRDWKSADAIALLDEVAALKDSPLSMAMRRGTRHTIRNGEALPEKFADTSWGVAQPNGLRAAWVLEPGAVEHRIGAALKARLLVWNPGAVPVMLQVPTWHQGGVKATDAKGAEVEVSSAEWTTMAQLVPVRLGPGEYIEISTPGIGFGPRAGMGPWAGPRVGSNVLAKPGDELTLTHGLLPLDGSEVGVSEDDPHVSGPGWWLAHIKTRLNRELPLPSDAAERTRLLDRAVRELFATAPSAEETAAFVADTTPDALDALVQRLAARSDVVSFSGKLPTAPAKFRVLAADPNADKQPRVVLGPGEFPVGEGTATLKIVGRPVGDRNTNDAELMFVSEESAGIPRASTHKLNIPDGWGTWAIVCRPAEGFFYLLHKGGVRKIDYSAPAKVTDTPTDDLPAEFRDEVKRQLDIHEVSAEKQAEIFENPEAPAATPTPPGASAPKLPKLPDDAYAKLGVHCQSFPAEDAKRPGGELMGGALEPSKPADRAKEPLVLGVRTASDAQWRIGGTAKVGLVVRNRTGIIGRVHSGSDVKFSYTGRLDNGLSVVAVDEAGKEHEAAIAYFDGKLIFQHMLLPVAHVATIKEFTLRFDAEKRDVTEPHVAAFHLQPGKYTLRCKWSDARPDVAHEGEWTGELVNEELAFTITAAAPPPAAATEKPKPGGAKLTPETEAQLDWGDAVNGLRAAVVVRSPQPGAAPGIFLAVQNVSAAALRFTDSMAAKEQRKLYLSDSAGILAALTSGEPTKTDAVLPPRGVLFLPMFPEDLEKKGEAALIEGIRKDSLQTWRAALNIENAPEGAWKGKLTTAETRGAVSADGPQPKNEAARALFKFWQRSARLNGDIPGGLLARLHDKVKEFIRNNTGDASGDPYAKKMAPLEPRFGPAGDWKPADVVALLDDIAAVTTIPLKTTLLHHGEHTLRHGQPLPAVLEKADWGEPLDGGLRMAFLLEPRAAEYHVGTEVKARILLHNSGKEAVAFIAGSFHQPGHNAHLADGGELKLDATDWLTRSVPHAWRLAPGEYIEVNTPGLGIGAHDKERAEWSDVRAGSWILCKEGDEVTFLPGAVMLTSKETPIDPDWWLKFITERLEREAPVPLDTKEREYLLYRVVRELFGTAPSTTEGDAFAADKSPDALKNLAVLLTKHQYGTRCEGPISAGETKFRVLPPDPDADKKPRVAMNPGRYTLGGSTTLVVTRRPDGRRIVNEAHLSYNSPLEEGIPAPHHKIELPDGYDTWAAACVRGETVLWLSQKGRLLKIDFTNFGKIQETRYEGEKTDTAPIPADIREALRAALTVPDAPKQIHEPLKPAAATPASPAASAPALEATEKPKGASVPSRPKLPEDAYAKPGVHFDKFREEDAKRPGGERMGAVLEPSKPEDRKKEALVLGVRTASDAQWRIGGTAKVGLVVRNRSDSDVKFSYTGRLDNGLSVVAVDEAGKEHGAVIGVFDGEFAFQQMLLPVAHVATIKGFTIRFDAEKRGVSDPRVAAFHLPPGKYKLRCKWNDARPEVAHEGEWTGQLVNEELEFTLAAAAPDAEKPKTPAAGDQAPKQGAKLKPASEQKLKWGDPVNGLRAALIMHPVPDEPDAGDKNDIFLVVQNVTKAEVWLHASDAAPNPRQLIWREKGILETINEVAKPIPADFRLQPGEVAFFRMTHPPAKPGGRNEGSVIAASIHHDPTFDLTGKMEIEKAPAGAWTGKLLSGEIKGGTAIPGFSPAENQGPASDAGAPPKKGDNVVPGAEKPKGAAVKLTADALLGFWRGKMDGKDLTLSFHRPPVEKDVQLDIYEGEATIGELAAFTIAADGGSALVGSGRADSVPFGTLRPGKAGTLKLELHNPQKGQTKVTLTHDAEPPATEPRQKEPRELFEMWKTTANEDGTIPGTFIGALATEVRAYVKAHPNLDSGMELPKLLPRFVTSRDWTQAEAIKLLDDVAYYATEPIAARVAKAKLPSDALWRSMVEFQDIPVKIAKWSEAKDGLRIGMRVVEGEWRVGGGVNVEMWLHNAGTKDLTLKANPQRSDVGVWVVAKDSEGQDHGAANGNIRLYTIPQACVVPAGHVAKIKNFTLSLDAPGNKEQAWMQPRFRELQPGSYKLRCEWSDAERRTGYGPDFSTDKFWTGKLTTPELDFTLVAQDAPKTAAQQELPPVDGQPARPKLADDRYAKSGVPLAEQTWPMPPWGAEKDGLSAGLRVIGDARIGGEVKAELWVRNSSAKDVKFSQCLRADVGLSVVAKDKDGKEHSADITLFLGRPVFHHLLLPPGHIVKVKEFNVKFGAGKNDNLERRWVNLQVTPGDYKLHAKWRDAASHVVPEGEWTAELTTGEVDLKIAAAKAGAEVAPGAKPAAQLAKLPDSAYAKSGVPIGEFDAGAVNWSGEQNGLCLGMSVEENAEWRIGGAVKVGLWACNPGEKDVKFQHSGRRDIGLRVYMKGADGKELAADIPQFRGEASALPVLLPAGHVFKAKEFSVVFLPQDGKAAGAEPHFTLAAGGYKFRCELKLPGLTMAGADGKLRTPAEGEWTGTLKSGEVDVKLLAADAPRGTFISWTRRRRARQAKTWTSASSG